jgi:hypothetical protein
MLPPAYDSPPFSPRDDDILFEDNHHDDMFNDVATSPQGRNELTGLWMTPPSIETLRQQRNDSPDNRVGTGIRNPNDSVGLWMTPPNSRDRLIEIRYIDDDDDNDDNNNNNNNINNDDELLVTPPRVRRCTRDECEEMLNGNNNERPSKARRRLCRQSYEDLWDSLGRE